MLIRYLIPILLWCMTSVADANTMSYYPDQASAYAACQAEGSIPGQACSPSGYALVRWCGTYSGCNGGCAVIIQTSQAPYPGGQCPYSVQTEYHSYTYPSVPCPAGYTFTGPLGNDCISPGKTQAIAASQPQNGGGSPLSVSSCPAVKETPVRKPVVADSSKVGNPCDAATGNKLHSETDFAGGFGIPSFQRFYNSLKII